MRCIDAESYCSLCSGCPLFWFCLATRLLHVRVNLRAFAARRSAGPRSLGVLPPDAQRLQAERSLVLCGCNALVAVGNEFGNFLFHGERDVDADEEQQNGRCKHGTSARVGFDFGSFQTRHNKYENPDFAGTQRVGRYGERTSV